MRKEKMSFVLAHIRTQMIGMFGSAAEQLTAQTLLDNAENMGFVTGKRGRDGGYFVTDAGLAFIGEDVEAFKAAELAAEEANQKTAKERQAQAAKQRREKLAASLNAALVRASVLQPQAEDAQATQTTENKEVAAEEVSEKPKKKKKAAQKAA